MSYTNGYLMEICEIAKQIDQNAIEKIVNVLSDIYNVGGRLFFIGVGGGAANAAHAVNDFRKLAYFEAYAPTDNVSELTARANDNGWDSIFADWLKGSRLCEKDGVFVFSVGGGDVKNNVSANIVRALKYAKEVGSKVLGVVGREGGYTARVADACVIIPTINAQAVTPQVEAFQAVIWHLIVSHPKIKRQEAKWESVAK